jgi:hypothetical protein
VHPNILWIRRTELKEMGISRISGAGFAPNTPTVFQNWHTHIFLTLRVVFKNNAAMSSHTNNTLTMAMCMCMQSGTDGARGDTLNS